MPVQLKINECIVIIVNIVVIVKVRRKFMSAAFFISPPTRPDNRPAAGEISSIPS